MTEFKIGDRVLVAEDATFRTGYGEVLPTSSAGTEQTIGYDYGDGEYGFESGYIAAGRFLTLVTPAGAAAPPHDPVQRPSYYRLPNGLEVMDFAQHYNFARGSALKYIGRAGKKNKDTEIQDLEKAVAMLQFEIKRLKEDDK